jgi:hypothetical protein
MEGNSTKPCGSLHLKSVGFIRTKKYSAFEQCYMFCLEHNIDYHSCQSTIEHVNQARDFTLHFVFLFTLESAMEVASFMNKMEQDFIYVNIIEQC